MTQPSTAAKAPIELQQAHDPQDDWSGLASAKERRKLQNRLNQRAYRERKKQASAQEPSSAQTDQSTRTKKRKISPSDDPSQSPQREEPLRTMTYPIKTYPQSNSTSPTTSQPLSAPSSTSSKSTSPISPGSSSSSTTALTTRTVTTSVPSSPSNRWHRQPIGGGICTLSAAEIRNLAQQFSDEATTLYAQGSPRTDMLLTLIHFNVFRALLSNTYTLGFTPEDWITEEAISPYCDPSKSLMGSQCPASLKPTALQRKVPHHPWIDLLPFPAMRDNIFAQGEDYDDMGLCEDIVEFCNAPAEHEGGLVVWGDPAEESSWEVTEAFGRKWGWVLSGCRTLKESTNLWRERRGEGKILWEEEEEGGGGDDGE